MKVAIIGSREKYLADPDAVRNQVLGFVLELPREKTIVSGGARGVDSYASEAARIVGLTFELFLADWDKYGKSAGAIRNKLVIEAADRIVAFWDGESPGTYNGLRQAKAAGKPIQVFTVARRVPA
jgi:predicted Rossmann fold nucleotide-binding protein DprA/Smf involved in DNA uptake